MASSAPQPATDACRFTMRRMKTIYLRHKTTSLASIYKGYMVQGRRHESVRSETYYVPADDKAWEADNAGHMLFPILDSQRSNTLFRSPLSPDAQHIIDLGTGPGSWALDVADRWPNYIVRDIDLFPPPRPFTAPNCIFEVDDITKPWTWSLKFDLCHMRKLLNSWDALYERIYDNTAPGGWIEQVEQDVGVYCDDDTLPKDSIFRTWKELFIDCGARAGRPLDTRDRIEDRVRAAGFINVYKDAGRVYKTMFKVGMDGWVMFLLTHFGQPTPWTADEVQAFRAKSRNELDKGYHIYSKAKRVWAQKPYDAEPPVARSQPVAENLAEESPSPAGQPATATIGEIDAKSGTPETQDPTKK